MKVAIVGASASKWENPDLPKMEIRRIMTAHQLFPSVFDHLVLVSGRCPKGGVDVWAEEINAAEFHWPVEIYAPRNNRWEPDGYKYRNLLIAGACDVLYCLSRRGVWDGGRWTAEQARKLGKTVAVVEI